VVSPLGPLEPKDAALHAAQQAVAKDEDEDEDEDEDDEEEVEEVKVEEAKEKFTDL